MIDESKVENFSKLKAVITELQFQGSIDKMIYFYETLEYLIQACNDHNVPDYPETAVNDFIDRFVSACDSYKTSMTNYRENKVQHERDLVGRVQEIMVGDSFNPSKSLAIISSFINGRIFSENRKRLEDIAGLSSEIARVQKNAEDVLKKLEEKAEKIAVSEYANIFSEQSKRHRNYSVGWIAAAVIMVGLLGYYGYHIYNNDFNEYLKFVTESNKAQGMTEKSSASFFVFHMITRFAFISVAIYLLSFAIKQYGVQMHLATLNKHRSNTLSTFDLFAISAVGEQNGVREVVLTQIAKAIYDAGDTGFIKSSDNGSPSLVEMTKLISESK